nr:MAG TPA: hypothetical protein [Microviridae sp.]
MSGFAACSNFWQPREAWLYPPHISGSMTEM